jgi:hypothetical protein
MGEVQEMIPPTNPKNISKKVNEYTVYVQHMSNNTMVGRMYNYCTVSNMFGSIADSLSYTLRADPSAGRSSAEGIGKGAKVLMMCINGSNANAVILGAIHDSSDKPDGDEGHHFTFVFNGVEININDAGELKLSIHGKTDLDGKTEEDDVGTTITLSKAGGLDISCKGDINVKCSNATVTADTIQLGEDGLTSNPLAGVVLGKAIEPLTGKTAFQLQWTSKNVTAKD